jgi:multidrug transporter EmrE-like cation transporter
MVLGYVLLNSFGALVIKYRINKMGEIQYNSFRLIISYFIELLRSPLIICGVLSIFLSAFLWMIALSRLQISLAYPVAVGLNFIIVVSIALIFLREQLPVDKMAAILLIIISIIILSR